MRGMHAIGCLFLMCIGASLGCKTEPKLKPPAHPDDFIVPPMADARFSSPDYPKAAFKTSNDQRAPEENVALNGRPSLAGASRAGSPGMTPY